MRDFVQVDELLASVQTRREAALDAGSPYRIAEGNPFANDCPLPSCGWDGKSDRELAEHLTQAHGDLTIRRRASVLARRAGRVMQISDMAGRRHLDADRGGHEARG